MQTQPLESTLCVAVGSADALPLCSLSTKKRKMSSDPDPPTSLSSKSRRLYSTLTTLVDQVRPRNPRRSSPTSSSKALRQSPPRSNSFRRSFSARTVRRARNSRSPPFTPAPSTSAPFVMPPITVVVKLDKDSSTKSPPLSDDDSRHPSSTSGASRNRRVDPPPRALASNDLRHTLHRTSAEPLVAVDAFPAHPPQPLGQFPAFGSRRDGAPLAPLPPAGSAPSRPTPAPPAVGGAVRVQRPHPAAHSAALTLIGGAPPPTRALKRRIRRHAYQQLLTDRGGFVPLQYDILPAHYEPPREPDGAALGPPPKRICTGQAGSAGPASTALPVASTPPYPPGSGRSPSPAGRASPAVAVHADSTCDLLDIPRDELYSPDLLSPKCASPLNPATSDMELEATPPSQQPVRRSPPASHRGLTQARRSLNPHLRRCPYLSPWGPQPPPDVSMDRVIAHAQGCRDPPADPETVARCQAALRRTRVAGCMLEDIIATSLITAPSSAAASPARARPAPARGPKPSNPGPPDTPILRASDPAPQPEPFGSTSPFLQPPTLLGGPGGFRPLASGFRPVPVRPLPAGPARALPPTADPAPVIPTRVPLPDPPEGRAASPSDSPVADSDFSVELASRSASPPDSDYGSALLSGYASAADVSDSDVPPTAAVTPVTPLAPSPTSAQITPGSPTPPPARPADDWEQPPPPPRRPIRWTTQVDSI